MQEFNDQVFLTPFVVFTDENGDDINPYIFRRVVSWHWVRPKKRGGEWRKETYILPEGFAEAIDLKVL